nr:NADH dehydrogenase subunit 2 [Dendrobaena veneta]WGU49275.1 NADH dehydrogenase subunit 2 [Dendrobaena veneta]
MSLIYSPFTFMASSSLVVSTMMALSSANWILLWTAMELNLLSFIPLILQSSSNQETEGSVKYFLAQALGSALLLMSSSAMWMPFTPWPNTMPFILTLAVMLKLGSVPCHFWYPSVMSSISWMSCLILSTWQKLAPLSIMAYILSMNNMMLITMMAGLNALLGGIMGMNQSQVRTIMAYSSIGHIGWMLSLMSIFKPNTSMLYFIIYSTLITPLFMIFSYFNIFTVKQMSKMSMINQNLHISTIMLLMSLGGLPPLTGFIPKFMSIMLLTDSMSLIMIMLIVGSVMNLYFYLNIIISMLFSTSSLNKSSYKFTKFSPMLILSVATMSLGLAPIIMS